MVRYETKIFHLVEDKLNERSAEIYSWNGKYHEAANKLSDAFDTWFKLYKPPHLAIAYRQAVNRVKTELERRAVNFELAGQTHKL